MEEEVKKPRRHLFYIRLIAGLLLLAFGVLHLVKPENFEKILQATDTPFISFNLLFVPIVEVIVGILFLLGLFSRFAGLIGLIVMGVATWSSLKLMHLDPKNLPKGIEEVPFSPPIFIPVILALFSLYILIMGAGAYSLDNRSKN